jgi:hypothetical protein
VPGCDEVGGAGAGFGFGTAVAGRDCVAARSPPEDGGRTGDAGSGALGAAAGRSAFQHGYEYDHGEVPLLTNS